MDRLSTDTLPISGNYEKFLKFSLFIAALMLISSATSIIFNKIIYPTEEFKRSFLANDFMNILIGVPVMLIPTWMVKSKKSRGILLWPGAMLYVIYNYLVYLISLPFSIVFLFNLTIISLSLITCVWLLSNMDWIRIKKAFTNFRLSRWISALLIIFGALFLARAGLQIANHFFAQARLPISEIALNTADITFSIIWILCGVSFLLGKPLGYKTSLGLMYQLSALFIGLIGVMAIQPTIMHTAIDLISLALVAGMSLVVIIPFFAFNKALKKDIK